MFLDIIHRLVHFLKSHNVSETEFCLRPQVKPIQLDPIDRASPYYSCLSIYGSTALVDHDSFFSFLIYTQSVGLPGRGISRSQGRYLHIQYKHKINAHRYPCLERNSNPRSQCSSVRRRFMPYTARPMRWAIILVARLIYLTKQAAVQAGVSLQNL
jgi:hypothetical protein